MIMESKVISFLYRIFLIVKKDYDESLANKIVIVVANFVVRIFSGSKILRFFTRSYNQSYVINKLDENSRLMKILDGSLLFKLLDFFNKYYLIEFGYVVSVVFLPTAATIALSFVIILNSVYRLFKHGGEYLLTHVFVLSFLIILTFSGLTGIDKGAYIVTIMYFSYLFALIIMTGAFKNKEDIIKVLVMSVVVMAICALYGFYQYVVGVEVDPAWIDEAMFGANTKRIFSFFANPNVYGIFLVMILPVTFSFILFFKNVYVKLAFVAVFLAGAINLALTMSRGSMIGFLIAIYLLLIFIDRRFIVLGIVGIMLMPFVLPASIVNRIMSIGNLNESSSAYRVSIYLATINMIQDFFVSGVGLGSFQSIYPEYAFSASKSFHAHNTFLMVFAEDGIVGLVSYLVFLVSFAKQSISFSLNSDSKYKYVIMSIFCGILGASIQGLFEHIWHNYDVMFFYFFFIMIGVALTRKNMVRSGNESS